MTFVGEASGFVLAGGGSTRMGQDKARLRFNGTALIERALATMRAIAEPVCIVGRRADLSDLAPVIEDRREGCGPLGGIEAALYASQSELNCFLPVDTPFVPAGFLTWMLQRAMSSGAVVTIPVYHGEAQPLIAVYSRRILPSLTEAIHAGRFKTIDALVLAAQEHGGADLFRVEVMSTLLPSQLLSSDALAGNIGPGNIGQWFRNLNTPADLRS